MPLSSGPELLLDRREGEPDHPAAQHLRAEADLVDRAHDADRIRRIGRNENDVGIGRLNRAHDRRIVDRVRRIAAVVDDFESQPPDRFPRARQHGLRVFGVGPGERDRLRLGLHRHRGFEEAELGREPGLLSVRQDLKIFVIAEIVVHPGAEQRHE